MSYFGALLHFFRWMTTSTFCEFVATQMIRIPKKAVVVTLLVVVEVVAATVTRPWTRQQLLVHLFPRQMRLARLQPKTPNGKWSFVTDLCWTKLSEKNTFLVLITSLKRTRHYFRTSYEAPPQSTDTEEESRNQSKNELSSSSESPNSGDEYSLYFYNAKEVSENVDLITILTILLFYRFRNLLKTYL